MLKQFYLFVWRMPVGVNWLKLFLIHFFPDQLKAFSAGSNPAVGLYKEVNPKAIRSLNSMGINHE